MAPRGKKPAAGEATAPARKKPAAGRTTAPATSRRKPAELPAQPRPDAPLDSQAFLRAAQPVLRLLEADLLARARASAAISLALARRHAAERQEGRTAATLDEWQRALVVQVAAAWLLSCVFVRTLEDRGAGAGAGLLGHGRIAGPGAMDSQRQFFDLAPSLTERDYLLTVFREMTRLPGVRDTFDARHNPVWKLAPSAQATRALLALFRAPDPEAPAFRFGQADTRFLGDLYQDLSEDVRKRFALLQTPAFVESFILDRTLERAVHQFGVADTTVIDPTCGSGHFLLGAFDRLYNHRLRAQPGLDPREAAHLALDAIFGADINPYAVAIARFRLTLAFIEKGGYKRIKLVPRLPLHLVVADSLLHNPQHAQASFAHMTGQSVRTWEGDEFALDDETAARDVLHRRFTAVVGNPPYITVKDAVLREKYRDMYTSAAGKYALAAPFAERFFQLARPGGFAGMITANSFMKREFGKKLIEQVLPELDLDLIVNTAGAYIPGHGTPTVLLFGRNRQPEEREVLAVLSKRGEPSTPENPEQGLVWQSIAGHWNDVGHEDDFISVTRMERDTLKKYPWSLGGGGASDLKELLEERAENRLGQIAEDIGFASFTGLDDAFIVPRWVAQTQAFEHELIRPMVVGESIRDWGVFPEEVAITPYDVQTQEPRGLVPTNHWARFLWRYRTVAQNVSSFGGKSREAEGQNWWQWYRWQPERYRHPFRLAFAFVATHNHFVLDRGGKVFNRSAPIIKLPQTATEDDHLALLAYLNSSTACFWLKQVSHSKTNHTDDRPENFEPGTLYYEFTSKGVSEIPLPPKQHWPTLTRFARAFEEVTGGGITDSPTALAERLVTGDSDADEQVRLADSRDSLRRARLVALQEDLDWFVYSIFELCNGVLGQRIAETWAIAPEERLFLNPLPPLCLDEPAARRWQQRALACAKDSQLQLLEHPENKRRWIGTGRGSFAQKAKTFRERCEDAILDQILSRIELALPRIGQPTNVANLFAEAISNTPLENFARWVAGASDSLQLLQQSMKDNAVPFLASYRHTLPGLEKRTEWEKVWHLQREEDAGRLSGEIPVPPKYVATDFLDVNYYRLRGKLDVPRERFISYPGCESEHDALPVYGWAGWNHLQRLQALALLYQDRKRSEGWPAERLVPMLAGMVELLPWVKQWHNDPDPAYDGLRLGDYFEGFVKGQCDELGISLDDVRAWRPAARKARRGKATAG